jgi:hypothetical protein
MRRSEGANSVFSSAPRRSKGRSCVELLKFIAAFRTILAVWETGQTKESALRTVKSFAALSVRERSSGNSEATIAHSSRLTNAMPSVLTVMIGRDILRHPTDEFILLSSVRGKV